MKKYIKPNTEELEMELEQMIAESIIIKDEDADDTNNIYDESRIFNLAE